ncbi:polymer-forming cytoskeletal protein [uncultured Selenomonas sp.]|uniref:bactofilin family protein n=1 Tax=uncultured Selenomonas sp. TaxID=159275 RepID=UPI0028DB6689|nr:polymer-forming cytoskeletal protein [uncultured Selenomonas sp.]
MFGVMKRRDDGPAVGDIETVIGKNTKIQGEVSGTGNLRIDGEIEGELKLSGSVIVGETGMVTGNVSARSLDVSGTVHGNAQTEEGLTIHTTGQLIGDVKVNAFQIEDGGIFKGRSEMNPRAGIELKLRAQAAAKPAQENSSADASPKSGAKMTVQLKSTAKADKK